MNQLPWYGLTTTTKYDTIRVLVILLVDSKYSLDIVVWNRPCPELFVLEVEVKYRHDTDNIKILYYLPVPIFILVYAYFFIN